MTFTVLPVFVITSNTEVEPRCEVTLVTLIEIFLITCNNGHICIPPMPHLSYLALAN